MDLGLVRKPSAFVSTICDDRKEELSYAGMDISRVFSDGIGIGGVVSLLWFRRKLPEYACRFLEMVRGGRGEGTAQGSARSPCLQTHDPLRCQSLPTFLPAVPLQTPFNYPTRQGPPPPSPRCLTSIPSSPTPAIPPQGALPLFPTAPTALLLLPLRVLTPPISPHPPTPSPQPRPSPTPHRRYSFSPLTTALPCRAPTTQSSPPVPGRTSSPAYALGY